MNSFPRRALARLSILAVTAGLALSLSAGDTLARDNRIDLSNTDDCTYAGKTYSEGSVVVMDDGKKYKCHNGHWDEASFQPPDDGTGWTFPQETAPVYYTP